MPVRAAALSRTPLLLLLLLQTVGCGAPYAVRYTVKPGEDAASIARAHGVPEESLRAVNRLEPGDRLRPGDTVFLPAPSGGSRASQAEPASHGAARSAGRSSPEPPASRPAPPAEEKKRADAHSPASSEPDGSKAKAGKSAAPERGTRNPAPSARAGPTGRSPERETPPAKPSVALAWPVAGTVLRGFGKGGGGDNRGVDIGVAAGTPVKAAAAGKVTYAGTPARVYGPVVILEHGGGLHTVYSNLRDLAVTRGESVSAGQPIGTSGEKAVTPQPHVHFEVRRNGEAVDPLLFLPPR